MENTSRYELAPGIRARREGFGLLFYNSNDTNLTFVKSRGLLDVAVDPKKGPCLEAAPGQGGRIGRLLRTLREKGLIRE